MATAIAERPALYRLWPRQQAAMRLLGLGPDWERAERPVEELLYGGEAGGGKSHLLRAIGVTLCTIWPGAVVPLFRRTYPELEETHVRRIQAEVPRSVATYNEGRHELRFPNGSVLEFRYCERENDVFRYQSAEFDALLLDEATHFTEHQVRYLRSRVRSTRPGWRPVIVYGSNPGNVGHQYFKTGFVDGAPAGSVFAAPPEDGGLRRYFLRARLDDNPALGADYRKMLEGIADEALRRALMDGDWDVFAGQFFREWRRALHVIEPGRIPAEWPRWTGTDWGWRAPSCTLWATRSPRTRRVYVYRERYETEKTPQQQAMKNVLWSGDETYRRRVGDPSMWNKESSGRSIAQQFAAASWPMVTATNDRAAGWAKLHDLLGWRAPDPETGDPGFEPRLYVFSTCLNLIRTLPSLVYDATDTEDLDSDGEDHAADALRYLVMAMDVQGDKRRAEKTQYTIGPSRFREAA